MMGEKAKKPLSYLIQILSVKKWLALLAIAAVAGVLIFGVRSAFRSSSKTTELGLHDIGELATQVAYVTEVDVIDDPKTLFGVKIPFTQSHYVYSYDFVIKAGFVVENINPEVDEKAKVVTIKMPEAEVLSNEPKLESLKIYLENESVFNQVTMDESNQAFIDMKKSAQENAIANGLLEGAKENACNIITGLFADQFDPNKYQYKFEFKGD